MFEEGSANLAQKLPFGVMKILITDFNIFAYHGLWAEERKRGSWFSFSAECEVLPGEMVDYVLVCKCVEECFCHREDYLESVVERVGRTLLAQFSALKNVRVRIEKCHPPVRGRLRIAVEEYFDREDK